MTTDTTTKAKRNAIKVKFIDANRHQNDQSPWPMSSSVAFLTSDENGVSILFKERISYQPGDRLSIKFDDIYGGDKAEHPTE